MKIGVTGTRSGMNDNQKVGVTKVLEFLKKKYPDIELHHGDCIGVDVEVANIAQSLSFQTRSHPPIKNDLRAFHNSDVIYEPLDYFKRNRKIVDSIELLLVIPYQSSWQPNGGTWYTHDYAKKKNKRILIIFP